MYLTADEVYGPSACMCVSVTFNFSFFFLIYYYFLIIYRCQLDFVDVKRVL